MASAYDSDGNRKVKNNNATFFTTKSDLKKLRDMAQMHCSVQEMADVFGCTRDLIYKNEAVMAIIREEKAKTAHQLRKRMILRAQYDGEEPMLLNISQRALEWCHKFRLGDKEKAISDVTTTPTTFLPPAASLDDKVPDTPFVLPEETDLPDA